MQHLAADQHGNLVLAIDADPNGSYTCLKCEEPIAFEQAEGFKHEGGSKCIGLENDYELSRDLLNPRRKHITYENLKNTVLGWKDPESECQFKFTYESDVPLWHYFRSDNISFEQPELLESGIGDREPINYVKVWRSSYVRSMTPVKDQTDYVDNDIHYYVLRSVFHLPIHLQSKLEHHWSRLFAADLLKERIGASRVEIEGEIDDLRIRLWQ